MNKEKQAEYDEWFVAMISKIRPELIDNIKEEYWDENDINYKVLEFKPKNSSCKSIFLRTTGCELTTSFDTFHSHTDQFEDDNHEEELIETLNFIDLLMKEEYVIVDYYEKDRLVMGGCQHKDDKIEKSKKRTIKVKSYKGTYNKTYKPKRFKLF
jgi:hypothetical protein